MTLWEFICAKDGHAEANGAKRSGRELSDERLSELGIEGF